MLPRVKITFANGAIGSTTPMDDGVAALIAPIDKTTLQSLQGDTPFNRLTPYLLTSLADLEGYGFNAAVGASIYRIVSEFYSEAPTQSQLWLMTYITDTTAGGDYDNMRAMLESEDAKNLLRAARGEIRLLMIDAADDSMCGSVTPDTAPAAMVAAQNLCEWATTELYAPCMAIMTARVAQGTIPTMRPDLTSMEYNRVCVMDGCTDSNIPDSKAIGLLVGRLATIPVQRSVARVKTGPIKSAVMYLPGTAADRQSADRAELRGVNILLHDKGYIVPRTFVGKTGYYWSDDLMACSPSDDYSLIPRRRTIDKAYRVAYKTLVEEIAEEIPVTDQGTPAPAILKAIETKVESAIVNNMTSIGNLGTDPADPNDLGVQCHIDPDQNILATSRLEIALRVKPYGYAKYIDVTLGFLVEQ